MTRDEQTQQFDFAALCRHYGIEAGIRPAFGSRVQTVLVDADSQAFVQHFDGVITEAIFAGLGNVHVTINGSSLNGFSMRVGDKPQFVKAFLDFNWYNRVECEIVPKGDLAETLIPCSLIDAYQRAYPEESIADHVDSAARKQTHADIFIDSFSANERFSITGNLICA